MKNIFNHLVGLTMLLIFSVSAAAQKTDSTFNKKEFKLAKGYGKQHDSLFTGHKKLFKYDSLYHSGKLKWLKADTLYSKQLHLKKMSDSLQKLYSHMEYDSFRHVYAIGVKHDSLRKYQSYQVMRLDSIKKEIYLLQIKQDSLQIKNYIRFKNVQSNKFYRDSIVVKNGYGSKRLSSEINCNPGDTIYINNLYRKVIIKNTASQKVKLSAIYFYKEEPDEKDDKIFQKMGVELSRINNKVTVTINGKKQEGTKNAAEKGFEYRIAEDNERRPLQIEIPGTAVVILDSKYAESNVEGSITNLNAEINNGDLRMGNGDNVVIKSNYATVKADNIKKADLNLTSTNFKASNIVTMSVVSRSSTINLNSCNSMNMASTGDNYNVDNAGTISGNKNFGKLQIENLKDQLILTGASADIKIDNISYEAPFIKIDNKYADLKLPLYNQQNYAVYYEGSYTDVNKLSTATQKLNGLGNITARLSVASDTLAGIGSQANVNVNVNINKTKFEAVAGNISGKHTKIDIVCPFCNVAFN